MKSLILFGSNAKLTKAHKKVSGRYQPPYYVRVRAFGKDFDEALQHAPKIMLPGETVLNTVPIIP